MTKEELNKLLKSLEITVNEGIQNDNETDVYPRIVYWDFLWDPIRASGSKYTDLVSYQISFFSQITRDPKLLELKSKLNKLKLNPSIEHEYVKSDRCIHSFFSLQVYENVQ